MQSEYYVEEVLCFAIKLISMSVYDRVEEGLWRHRTHGFSLFESTELDNSGDFGTRISAVSVCISKVIFGKRRELMIQCVSMDILCGWR